MPTKRAVFLDRDGTVNEEVDHLSSPCDLRLIPRAADAILCLNRANILVILVTNQAGVARGYFPETVVSSIHEELAAQLAERGARLDGIYYCPHHPDRGCECRKPNPGMLSRAAAEHGINLQRSYMVGDKVSDLEAGRRIGCLTVLVLTGYGSEAKKSLESVGFQPDCIARNLFDAVRWILSDADVRGKRP